MLANNERRNEKQHLNHGEHRMNDSRSTDRNRDSKHRSTHEGFRKPQPAMEHQRPTVTKEDAEHLILVQIRAIDRLVQQYRDSRIEAEDTRLTNTISAAAQIILNMAAGVHDKNEAAAWEMVESLIRQYTEAKYA